MNSFFENPGLCHIGTKIFFSLDFMNQINCREVCRTWNQIMEDLFSKMLSMISLEHLILLLDKYLGKRSLHHMDKIRWRKFLEISNYYFEISNTNRLFKLYMKDLLNDTKKVYRHQGKFSTFTPRHAFTGLGNTKMIRFMLLNHVPFLVENVETKCIEIRDDFERNLIHIAAMNGNVELLKKFCQKSNNWPNITILKARDWEGNTPLNLAAKFGHLECVKVLWEFKIIWKIDEMLKIRNKAKLNAIDMAQQNGHLEIVDFLHPFANATRTKKRNRFKS